VLADVNGTSGIQAQAYATSVRTTLRKGITKLETAGYTASAFVLHPTDWETTELALSSQAAIEHQGLPYDPANRRLYGVPVVTSNAQTAGVGRVVASGAVALDTDNRGVDVQWSENATADSFGKNQVVSRCESRFATSVFQPVGCGVARPDPVTQASGVVGPSLRRPARRGWVAVRGAPRV
jgi:Phage capsid family